MVKRIILPPGALDDVCTLLRLSRDQLNALNGVFSEGESAAPLRASFVTKVAETLRVNIDNARSIVTVCHFLLLHSEAKEDEEFVEDVLNDFREFLENSLEDPQKTEILSSFDRNRDVLASLATPKPAPLRLQKIRKLASGPEEQLESIRTICQLRPLFDGPEHEETIEGLVPVILVELELENEDGVSRTASFAMDHEKLDELENVIRRTREKLDAIQNKYGSELLSTD